MSFACVFEFHLSKPMQKLYRQFSFFLKHMLFAMQIKPRGPGGSSKMLKTHTHSSKYCSPGGAGTRIAGGGEIEQTKSVISLEEMLGKVIFLVTDERPAQ